MDQLVLTDFAVATRESWRAGTSIIIHEVSTGSAILTKVGITIVSIYTNDE